MKHIKITIEADGLEEPVVIEHNVIGWNLEMRNHPAEKPWMDAAKPKEWEIVGGSVLVDWDLKR